jgi:hypothetical protein
MNEQNTFDKNVPIAVVPRSRQDRFKLAGMQIGDSKFISLDEYKHAPTVVASAQANNPRGCKFSFRKLTEKGIPGIRIWRIK